jgi:radical SAM superfamily enzyme YgiQ (UPF0313 family)
MPRPDILLVNPWIHDFAAYDLWARPLGLLVLASRLRSLGWEPHFIDCLDPDHPEMPARRLRPHSTGRFARTPITKPEALKAIKRTFNRYGVHPEIIARDLHALPRPNAILVTSLMTYWYTGVQETVALLRHAFPGVPVILGGVYASLMPDHAAEAIAPDEVIAGLGEGMLAGALQRHTGLCPGDCEDQREPSFVPALDLLRKVPFLPVLSSRGCPFRCAYCASARLMPSFVQRSPKEVFSWLEVSRERYGCEDAVLYDDAFLVNPELHGLPILEATAERLPGMKWHSPNGLHASAVSRRVARAMKRAGFETIRLGLETTSSEFHSRTGSKTHPDRFREAVRHLREEGFRREQIGAYLLIGLPKQTKEQVERDVEEVLAAGAFPRLAEYSPVPGTRMWPDAVAGARYPIGKEPLFHNCTLLAAAEPEIDWEFLQAMRRKIAEHVRSGIEQEGTG